MNKTLFNPPLAHAADPQTSYAAADKMIKSGKLGEQEKRVLNAIGAIPGSAMKSFDFTAKKLFACSTISYYTIQRRLSGLRRKDFIGRARKDGGLCCGEHPNMNYLVKRNGQCVWRLK